MIEALIGAYREQRQRVDSDNGARYENFITTVRRVGIDPFKLAANAARHNQKQAA